MEYKEYFAEINAEFTKNIIDEETFKKIEEELGISFGPELKEYIFSYGYLAYKHIEYYGINSRQGTDSDMVKQTKYLHQYFDKTKDYIALGNTFEGKYALVSANDAVYEYDTELDMLNDCHRKLFDYIKESFILLK